MNKSLRNGGLTNPSICLLLLNMLSAASAASTVFEPAVVHASEPLSDVRSVGCECAAMWMFVVMFCVRFSLMLLGIIM